MDKIKCSSTTTSSELFPVVKVWLKMNHVEYEEHNNSVGGHYWKSIIYELSAEQLLELISYLREAEVFDKISEIII